MDNTTTRSYINRLGGGGGHSLPPAEPTDKRSVALMHEQEYDAEGSPSSKLHVNVIANEDPRSMKDRMDS